LAVRERDSYTCQQCGAQERPVDAHHIKAWTISPSQRYDLTNGITLCKPCHLRQHIPKVP
jgi:5-methylcytosine-specific restriction endonuclease McrA